MACGQETQPTLNSALCLRLQADGRHLIRPVDAPIPLGEARPFASRIAITTTFVLQPWSRSACRTHLRRASVEHPSFSAIEQIAAHWESYCSWCSKTMRMALSRTSLEYLLGPPIAPSSHQMEPLGIPGRFIASRESSREMGARRTMRDNDLYACAKMPERPVPLSRSESGR
jgi:hypothetical protein